MQKTGFLRMVWVCLALLFISPALALADDVLESIKEAMELYKEGNH